MSPDSNGLLWHLPDPLKLRAVKGMIHFPFVLSAADERPEEKIARAAERRRNQGKKTLRNSR